MHNDQHVPTTRKRIFKDEHGNTIKRATVAIYNMHMKYIDKGDSMAKPV